ncbi:sensor histidine kinase [Nonomuraea sp. NPDC005501]|uniref:sensor histidine kinase n=1 Tax=Nonomuraea sp. NPDC005501 TaxID=3156884 RepID=UPI0033A5CCED
MSVTTSPSGPSGSVADPFEHIGLLYDTPDAYAEGCAAFLRRALDAGEPAMVAVPGGNGDLIRSRLGGAASRVVFADMAVAGRNPGRIIPRVLLDFARRHSGQRVWIIGEPIWAGRSEVEYPACAAHEALINAAFAGRDAAILCPYDTAALGARAVEDSYRTHPVMAEADRTWASGLYADPLDTAAMFDQPLPTPPLTAYQRTFKTVGELEDVRSFTAGLARSAGLPDSRVERAVLAVNEVATNAFEHTTGGCTITVWTETATLVYQIDDAGHFVEPMAGRIPPVDLQSRGHGLILVNELSDLVRRHDHADGTTTRLHFVLG